MADSALSLGLLVPNKGALEVSSNIDLLQPRFGNERGGGRKRKFLAVTEQQQEEVFLLSF